MKKILISLLILIIFVLGLVFLLDKKDTILPDDDEQVFCTQEALMCPDGSYVGRSGPKCEFSPCPSVENLEEVSNTVKIKIGETKYVNGVRITLNKMVSESRCAADVQCITAGFASFEVVLKSDTDEERVVLASDKPNHPFDSFKVSIVDVSPVPLSTSLLDPKKYEVTFKVEAL